MSEKNSSKKVVGEKLQKVLASAGIGSRREMEQWISGGRVTVDTKPAVLGDRVTENQQIRVDGHPVQITAKVDQICRVIAYHKPEGEICSRTDPEGRPTVFSRLPNIKGSRWIAIGRLDINTSGLLLFTTDGELANRLMHPRFEVEREYAVRVFGEVNDAIIQRLRTGVELEDGKANFKKIKALPGEGLNRWFHVVLTEGRNREVRRMWESQGTVVNRLIRVRYGDLLLPKHLPAGGYAEYALEDVNYLRKLVNLAEEQQSLVKPEDRNERRRRMASMRRAVRKHQVANKTDSKRGDKPAAAEKPVASKPTKPVVKPAQRPTKPTSGKTPATRKPPRKPTGKKPTREGRG